MANLKKPANFRPRLGARTETAEEQITILQGRVDALEARLELLELGVRPTEEAPNGS